MRTRSTCPAGSRARAAALLLVAAATLAGCLVAAGESRIAVWKARVEGKTVSLEEADSVSVFPDSTHQGIVKDKKPLARVVELLAGI